MTPAPTAQKIYTEPPGYALEDAAARALERLYRPEDVARQLGVGRSLVWRLMKDGTLPYCHVGRFRRISGRAVAQFIEQRMADTSRVPAAAGREAG
jgi:excisionase family DNA binding protein